jgi:hypothetical protein
MDLKKITNASTTELKKMWKKHKDDEGISPVFGQQLKRIAQELKKRGEKLNEEKDTTSLMNEEVKKTVQQFIGDIANKDYSNAQNSLEQVVAEKIKNKVRNSINNQEK